jgi:hypothetical protein
MVWPGALLNNPGCKGLNKSFAQDVKTTKKLKAFPASPCAICSVLVVPKFRYSTKFEDISKKWGSRNLYFVQLHIITRNWFLL